MNDFMGVVHETMDPFFVALEPNRYRFNESQSTCYGATGLYTSPPIDGEEACNGNLIASTLISVPAHSW